MNLENIKVGDKLAYPSGLKSVRYNIHTVERITATQVVCGRVRFRKSDGRKFLDGNSFDRAILATSAILYEHDLQMQKARERTEAVTRLNSLSLSAHRMTTQQMNAVWAVLQETPPVEGDLLPAIGSRVRIHLASCDKWEPHTVVGYYVWSGGRVFVRVANKDGLLNARMLEDVRPA